MANHREQGGAAVLLWLGTLRLLGPIATAGFMRARTLAVVGLAVRLLLYMAGFVTIGGKWFAMGQSTTWNGQQKSFEFITMIGTVFCPLLRRFETDS